MDTGILAPWRDLSIVWLGLLTMIFVAVPGVAFYYAVRGMRALNAWLRPQLLNAQMWAMHIQHGTARVSNRIAAVPIALHSTSARISTTTRGVMDFLLNK